MSDLPETLPIDHVVDGVYISGWRATNHKDELRQAGITHVLKLYEDIPHFPDDFTTFENPLDDGVFVPADMMRRGVQFITEQVEAGNRVLVMCTAGISRSATFVLAYMIERGWDLHDAYRALHVAHPIALPHPEMWRSLLTHYDVPYTLKDAWEWMQPNGDPQP
jgi:dual specificity phosphatase 12